MSAGSRYDTILKLASGGMATVFVGTVRGALGFRQLVAIKKPHPHLLGDEGFRSELVAEARLASMIHHANVVDVRDVEIDGESITLVMDYIEGASLGELLVAASRKKQKLAPRVCVRIALDALAGLHAAHELVDERGRPVGLVHRDVSPQNMLVGTDGNTRVADFGVAKFARKNMQSTSEGSLKGKLAYMAPEYVRGENIDRRFDVFAMGVVLWESITGKRCFRGDNEAETLKRVLELVPEKVSQSVPEAAALDDVITCALAKDRGERFQNAAAMLAALENAAGAARLIGGHTEVASALKELAGPAIEERRQLVRSKLANEPSVASLMGVPPIAGAEKAPPTEVDAPATVTMTAAGPTPRMGGMEAASMTAPAKTPEMPGAPKRPATKPSPAADPAVRPIPQGIPAETLRDAPPTEPMPPPTTLMSAPANETLRSDPAMLDVHEASVRSFSGSVAPEGVPKRSPGWLMLLVVGLASAGIATAGLVYVSTRTAAAPAPTATATATASASATPPAPAPASATPTATPTASTTPSATPSAHTTTRGHGPPRATGEPTIKPPPPNPYGP